MESLTITWQSCPISVYVCEQKSKRQEVRSSAKSDKENIGDDELNKHLSKFDQRNGLRQADTVSFLQHHYSKAPPQVSALHPLLYRLVIKHRRAVQESLRLLSFELRDSLPGLSKLRVLRCGTEHPDDKHRR